MNKLAKLILSISFSFGLVATPAIAYEDPQVAVAYYQKVEDLSGFKLKTALKNLLKSTHNDRGYGALISIYFESDVDETYDGDGTIVDMYSESPNSPDSYDYASKREACGSYRREADCFNREHIFPQGTFHKRYPMRSDFFHIYPTDGYVNGHRSNYPFGEVSNPEWTSTNGSKRGINTYGSYRGVVFEPIDEFKGDIARALLYFATRYEDKVSSWNHPMLNGSRDVVYSSWFISLLLKWHKQDPVSLHESHRNQVGYKYQGNRNPFIDHPEWVEKIWGRR